MEDNININTGRIEGIINALKKHYKTNSIAEIPVVIKLNALCNVLDFTYSEFDSILADNSPVFRTIKGHCFEAAFQTILASNGIKSSDIGGDGEVDLVVNKHDLQLKTPNKAGTKGYVCEYKTHKTHGPKSEVESKNYYHKVENFAEFFVGLISYHPFRVFIIPREYLPKLSDSNFYIKSPFKINWHDGFYKKFVNAFSYLDIKLSNLNILPEINKSKELLPKTSSKTQLSTDIILNTILRTQNFRVWDMSIRGFARELAIKKALKQFNIKFSDQPAKYKPSRGEKADLVAFKDNERIFLQIKGVSTNNCDFEGIDSIVATETQLTRGRVNDHPTQSRLYLASDFDYLLLALDPPISKTIYGKSQWYIFLIPSERLERHHKFTNRYKSLQKFKAKELMRYELKTSKHLLL